MIPNLLDDLLRAWDTRGAEGAAAPGSSEQPQPPAAESPSETAATTPSPMDSLLSSLLTSFDEGKGGANEAPGPDTLVAESPLAEPVRDSRPHITCKYVAVSLGWHKFAVPMDSVVEAGRHPRTTLAPGLPSCVRGVFNRRSAHR